MASSRVMTSSPAPTTTNPSDLTLSPLSHHYQMMQQQQHQQLPSSNTMFYATPNSELVEGEINLLDAAGAISAIEEEGVVGIGMGMRDRTVEEMWKEIMEGKRKELQGERVECKVEATKSEVMTLEAFLEKAGVGGGEDELLEEEDDEFEEREGSDDVKGGNGGGMFVGGFDGESGFSNNNNNNFDGNGNCSNYVGPTGVGVGGGGYEVVGQGHGMMGGGSGGGVVGRGKRRGGPVVMEQLDKAAQQRQRRMIKNRESAARSRERKQVSF